MLSRSYPGPVKWTLMHSKWPQTSWHRTTKCHACLFMLVITHSCTPRRTPQVSDLYRGWTPPFRIMCNIISTKTQYPSQTSVRIKLKHTFCTPENTIMSTRNGWRFFWPISKNTMLQPIAGTRLFPFSFTPWIIWRVTCQCLTDSWSLQIQFQDRSLYNNRIPHHPPRLSCGHIVLHSSMKIFWNPSHVRRHPFSFC